MSEVSFHGWEFEVDHESTRAAYSATEARGAASCSCSNCRNYIAQRRRELPPEIREFLDSVGVDPLIEAETWAAGPLEEGYEFTNGWWHFIGSVVTEGPPNVPIDSVPGGASRSWSIQFLPDQASLKLKELPTSPLVQVEFRAELPWILNEERPG